MRSMMSCCYLAIVLTMLAAHAGHAADGDWPSWRGPQRDGKSLETGLLKQWPAEGLSTNWRLDEIGKGFSTVAIADGMIYTTGDIDDKLWLFGLDLDGRQKWRVEVDEAWSKSHPGSRSTPTIDQDRLYVLSGHGALVCYDAKSGERHWSREMKDFGGKPGGWGYAESALIYEDLVIVKPGGEQCIAALNKHSGDTVWTSTGFKAGPEYGSCIQVDFAGHSLIITGTRAGLVCVDARDGQLQWLNEWSANNTANCPTPVYSDGYVFWSNGYGKGGVCVKLRVDGDKVAADEQWTTKDMVCHHGGYIVQNGYIYGNHSNGWTCLELKTGQQQWSERAVGKGSLCFADGLLYLFGERGGSAGLATCSPDGMELLGEFSVEGDGPSWAHPVVAGGRLYLRYDTHLYCFDIRAH